MMAHFTIRPTPEQAEAIQAAAAAEGKSAPEWIMWLIDLELPVSQAMQRAAALTRKRQAEFDAQS